MITIVAILAAAVCSFGFLEYMMIAYWKAKGSSKDAPVSDLNKTRLFPRRRPGLECFGDCMDRFAWDVDETSPCAAKCRA
jgi:hypothetical protein